MQLIASNCICISKVTKFKANNNNAQQDKKHLQTVFA